MLKPVDDTAVEGDHYCTATAYITSADSRYNNVRIDHDFSMPIQDNDRANSGGTSTPKGSSPTSPSPSGSTPSNSTPTNTTNENTPSNTESSTNSPQTSDSLSNNLAATNPTTSTTSVDSESEKVPQTATVFEPVKNNFLLLTVITSGLLAATVIFFTVTKRGRKYRQTLYKLISRLIRAHN